VLAAGALALAAAVLPPAGTYLAAAVVGIGYAGAQLFPLAMLPDVAAEDAESTGQNRIGVFTGIWTAGETLGMALGPRYGLLLSLGGYVSSTDASAAQPSWAVTAIVLGFSVLPGVLVLASLAVLRGYRLRS